MLERMIDLPQYKRAIYANETATLENNYIRLDIHKRNSGWGWGEVYSTSGKLMCVFEHLGDVVHLLGAAAFERVLQVLHPVG